MPDERLLFRTRAHPIVLVGWVLLVLILLVGLLVVDSAIPRLLICGVVALVLAIFLLDYFGTVYEATTEAVSKRQGVVWRREERIPLGKIQDLKFSTGILGLILGFGRLEIESAGTEGKTVFDALPTWAYRILRPLRRNRRGRNQL